MSDKKSPSAGWNITDDDVEDACKAYADATGYYVPFHRGLSSESSDKMRKGMRAALKALRRTAPPDTGAEARLRKALRNVQKIISEAALTGFNHKDGDWADRLFASQQKTSAALSAHPKDK
jgi:hypothetical protein